MNTQIASRQQEGVRAQTQKRVEKVYGGGWRGTDNGLKRQSWPVTYDAHLN